MYSKLREAAQNYLPNSLDISSTATGMYSHLEHETANLSEELDRKVTKEVLRFILNNDFYRIEKNIESLAGWCSPDKRHLLLSPRKNGASLGIVILCDYMTTASPVDRLSTRIPQNLELYFFPSFSKVKITKSRSEEVKVESLPENTEAIESYKSQILDVITKTLKNSL